MTNRQSSKFRLFSILASILVLVVAGYYFSANIDQFRDIRFENIWLVLFGLVVVPVNIFAIGMVNELSLIPYGLHLTKTTVFGLASITRFVNQFAPGYIAAGIRAVFFKKNYKLTYTKFSSAFVFNNMLQFLISGTLGITLLILASNNAESLDAFWVIAILMTIFLLIIFLPLRPIKDWLSKRSKPNIGVKGRFLQLIHDYEIVRKDGSVFLSLLAWMLLAILTAAATLHFLYLSIGTDINFIQSLTIASFASWSIIFSITPSSIGIREGLMAFAAASVGIAIPETLTVAVLLRLVSLIGSALPATYYAPRVLGVSIVKLGSTNNKATQ